jgi:hypothetical protein
LFPTPRVLAQFFSGGAMSSAELSKQVYEKEAEALGISDPGSKPLTEYQKKLLDEIRAVDATPFVPISNASQRSAEAIAASQEIHKRVNPGYVEMPYKASSAMAFVYRPPPDFTKAFLKKESDCKFQKYAAEAILKHVDLKKTSH